jgi:hypothetical protein
MGQEDQQCHPEQQQQRNHQPRQPSQPARQGQSPEQRLIGEARLPGQVRRRRGELVRALAQSPELKIVGLWLAYQAPVLRSHPHPHRGLATGGEGEWLVGDLAEGQRLRCITRKQAQGGVCIAVVAERQLEGRAPASGGRGGEIEPQVTAAGHGDSHLAGGSPADVVLGGRGQGNGMSAGRGWKVGGRMDGEQEPFSRTGKEGDR